MRTIGFELGWKWAVWAGESVQVVTGSIRGNHLLILLSSSVTSTFMSE